MKWTLGLMLLFILTLSCEESEPALSECILEAIHLDDRNRLEFVTISGGKIYQVTQKYETDEEIETVASYRFNSFPDSLVILDQLNPGKFPFMRVNYENGRPYKIIRHFPTEDVLLTHDISYSNDLIEVNMSRVASTGDFAELGHGLYHLDASGNVFHVEKFRWDLNQQIYKYDERFFQYDQGISPLEGLLIPFFVRVALPDAEFSLQEILWWTNKLERETTTLTNTIAQEWPYHSLQRMGVVFASLISIVRNNQRNFSSRYSASAIATEM
ncbi:MAG: hypothetical protein CMB80_25640 [Flammeovirgaceae bacterium]|nr:hypothetical protein [Flammeovirgaceae bacterium]HCX22601.1 hypothetical protein [Cytophagales bacterium]|tara:strand:+ start:1977 stop:2789 length:813 start_codon:yes stop_codon:yes gene_type:complete